MFFFKLYLGLQIFHDLHKCENPESLLATFLVEQKSKVILGSPLRRERLICKQDFPDLSQGAPKWNYFIFKINQAKMCSIL